MIISVDRLKERMDAGEDIKLIDVRELHEHEEFNIGGQLIPLGSIPSAVEDLYDQRDDEIVLYCRSGNRSGQAQQYLMQLGFTNVLNLMGGMLAWQEKFEK